MAYQTYNRVLETSTTTGTGAYTLAGAVTGHQAASGAGFVNGDTGVYYAEGVDASGVPSGGWEVGLGTWGTGATWTRTTIYASSNAGAAVNWAAGTRRIGVTIAAGKNHQADVQTFTASGTWTKPLWAKFVRVVAIGAGGPGGSGARQATTVARTGGGGGGSGAVALMDFPASSLGATESVTVDSTTVSGAAVAVDSTAGNDGTRGNFSSLGTWVGAASGVAGRGNGTAGAERGGFPDVTFYRSNAGGSGTTTTGTSATATNAIPGNLSAAGGGGGGGAGASVTTNVAGGSGGTCADAAGASSGVNIARAGGSGGTAAGVAPTAGAASPANSAIGAAGGGAGAYRTAIAGMAGAAGGFPGGGGGGGSASDNGFASGAGGAGGGGLLIVVSF